MMATFAFRILPPRADFAATLTPEEAAVMGRHFVYLQGLHADGLVRFVGRTQSGSWGLTILDVPDLAAAQAIAAADPSVAGRLMQADIEAFRIVTLDQD